MMCPIKREVIRLDFKRFSSLKKQPVLNSVLIALGMLGMTTLWCYLLNFFTTEDTVEIMVYTLGVVMVARYTKGYRYGILAAVFAVFLHNYLFVKPYFNFHTGKADYPLMVLFTLLIAVLTSATTTRLREQEEERIHRLQEAQLARQALENEQFRSTILRSLSHDLRTPLTSIIGSSSVLLEKGTEMAPGEKAEMLANIHGEAIWMHQFTEDMLSLARIQDETKQLQLRPELVEEVVGEVLVQMRPRFSGRRVEAHIPPEQKMVYMDSKFIEQVLRNLLENALHHTPKKGSIEIRVVYNSSDTAFTVWNSGAPIPEAELPFIFEKHFVGSTSRFDTHRGTGLGLFICKTIVDAHGGEIIAANAAEGGVEFHFTIPTFGGNSV